MKTRFAMIATASATGALLLSACGEAMPGDARAASIQRCERQFGQMAPDPSQGNALCTCMVDDLAAEGLEVTDMLGGDGSRVEEITRNCASEVGVTLP